MLTFLPYEYVFLWTLAAVPFYIYLYCCYKNYLFFYEQVETAIREDEVMMQAGLDDQAVPEVSDGAGKAVPVYFSDIAQRMDVWIKDEGYRKPGLTLSELATQFCTNRTYLSEYINTVFQKNFRDWITDLRIGSAKLLMQNNPGMKVQDVSDQAGFLSLSHFSRIFREKEGCTPAKWRNDGAAE